MKKSRLLLIPMVLLIVAMIAGTALAAGDGAGNVFSSDKTVSGGAAERDYYWAGFELEMSGGDIGADGILAGKSINIDDSSFGGSLRTASYSANIKNTTVENNITAAGYSVSIGEGTSAAGIYAAGKEITFEGECQSITAAGETVAINGTVSGDASITAARVLIGENAVINGTLKVDAAQEPQIPDGAQVGKLEFTLSERAEREANAAAVTAGAIIVGKLLSLAYWLPAMLLLCVLLWLIFSKELDGAGKMLLARPVAMPITGLVSIIAFPIALAILCVTVIGLPTAGILLLIAIPVGLVSVTFAGASVGRLVFPKMHKLLSSIIGVAILTVLKALPYLGTLIVLASMVYTVGYLILVCFERIKALKAPKADAAGAAE